MRIDLNSDVGESFGPWRMGDDARLMEAISSANVACGFHAGDPSGIRRTVMLALAHGVAVGAHPGFPDLVGFGRRDLHATPAEVEDFVLYQVAALAGMTRAGGSRLTHVKAHGALYNMACRDERLARAIARGVAAFDASLPLVGLPESTLLRAGLAEGLPVLAEGFADRAYEPDGSLVSRRKAGSLIHDPAEVAARSVRMARDHQVVAIDGTVLDLSVDTICIHGDTPGAADLAYRIRDALGDAGVRVASPTAS